MRNNNKFKNNNKKFKNISRKKYKAADIARIHNIFRQKTEYCQ